MLKMKLLTVLGVTLAATFASGTMTTSALALPDISIALGGSYPLRGQFADNGTTQVKLETTGGSIIEGKGLAMSGSIEELSASGNAELEILGVKTGKTACHSQSDKEEEVLVKDTLALVPVRLAPLEIGILHTGQEVEIICGKIKIKIKGAVIDTLNAGEGELTEVGGKLEGSKGKNTLTKYFNDEGHEVEARLEANFGTGFLQADVTVGEEIKIKALEGKMFEITGR
jgi:hypothetical protein